MITNSYPRTLPLTKVGSRYGYWTVLEVLRGTRWKSGEAIAVCDCGRVKIVHTRYLRTGESKSCGCHKTELWLKANGGKSANFKHGLARTPEYHTWMAMRHRCYDSSRKDYPRYGGRGITICASWRESFLNFLKDMGLRPEGDYSIDRIDNDGNYEPDNCRWATDKQQRANKRRKAA